MILPEIDLNFLLKVFFISFLGYCRQYSRTTETVLDFLVPGNTKLFVLFQISGQGALI